MVSKAQRQPAEKKGPDLQPYQIILRPLVTEKTMHRSTAINQYAFQVNPLATKTQIKDAVEDLFNVKVAKVRTQNRAGKPRRYKFRWGRTSGWKKALVTLDKEHNIQFF